MAVSIGEESVLHVSLVAVFIHHGFRYQNPVEHTVSTRLFLIQHDTFHLGKSEAHPQIGKQRVESAIGMDCGVSVHDAVEEAIAFANVFYFHRSAWEGAVKCVGGFF